MLKKIACTALAVLAAASFSSCTPKESIERQFIEKQDKRITVLEDNEDRRTSIILAGIERFEGVRGMDWLDEEKMLISKDNTNMDPIIVEGESMYPKNLYILDTLSKEERALREEPNNQGFASYSPDKKYIFYKRNVEATARGFIMDAEGKNSIMITREDPMLAYEGQWVDQSHVFIPTVTGDFLLAGTDGEVKMLASVRDTLPSNAAMVENKIYYTDTNEKLIVLDLGTNNIKTIAENVVSLIPNQENKELAIVKRIGETNMGLMLIDVEGSEGEMLVEGMQIHGVSWSPDGSKIGYTLISEDGALEGLFVMDISSKECVQLLVDTGVTIDPIKWSPSGKRLLASTIKEKSGKYEFETYAITLK